MAATKLPIVIDRSPDERSPPIRQRRRLLPGDRHHRPHSARIWNYWLGGKDNYQVDRDVGDAFLAVLPGIVTMAQQPARFLIRAVRYLATEAGIRQFLDIGTGLPTCKTPTRSPRAVAPESQIVYVDNDPLVLAHARALLTNTTPRASPPTSTPTSTTPTRSCADATNTLDFTQPIAVMLMGILATSPTTTRPRRS